jgi:hypothetical protein
VRLDRGLALSLGVFTIGSDDGIVGTGKSMVVVVHSLGVGKEFLGSNTAWIYKVGSDSVLSCLGLKCEKGINNK